MLNFSSRKNQFDWNVCEKISNFAVIVLTKQLGRKMQEIIWEFLSAGTGRVRGEERRETAGHHLATDTQLGQRRLQVLILQVTITVRRRTWQDFDKILTEKRERNANSRKVSQITVFFYQNNYFKYLYWICTVQYTPTWKGKGGYEIFLNDSIFCHHMLGWWWKFLSFQLSLHKN